ncbi:hypothetical protein N9903_00270, partial [bacterium]|nr:hypothetical protein [bacterium]
MKALRRRAPALSLVLLALGCLVVANNGLAWRQGAWSLDMTAVPALFLAAFVLFLLRDRERPLSNPEAAAILTGVLVLYLLSDYAGYKWFFWISLAHRRALFLLAVALVVLFAVIPRRIPAWAVFLLLLISQLYLTFQLFDVTGGLPLQRDDHPSFLYRLQILRETYPQIISYDPRWNGGRIATELLQTGILTVAPFFIPLGKLFSGVPMEKLYTPFIAFLFHWLFPWLFYLGLRLFGADRATALWGALLSLYPNRYFFINLLPWGVFPSLLAMALVVPAAGALYRIVVLKEPGVVAGLTLALSLTLASFWPASFFTFLPLALLAVIALPGIDRRSFAWLTLSVALFLLLVSPWLRALLTSGEITKLSGLGTARTGMPDWNNVRRNLEHLNFLSPLLLVFGIPALLARGDRTLRRWVLAFTVLYLLFLGLGNEYKKQFQFLRIVNSVSYIMIVPAAFWMGRIFSFSRRRDAAVRGVVLASVLFTVYSAGYIWSNKGFERYSLPGETERQLVGLLKGEVPPTARVFWAGRTMHGFGGGHVAPLPYLTGKMMMASDFYHFHIGEIGGSYDLMPREVLKGEGREERTERWFDSWNVSHVVSVEGRWIRYLDGRPELYELIWEHKDGDFWIMVYRRRNFTGSLFEVGSGSVEVLPGRIRVRLDGTQE